MDIREQRADTTLDDPVAEQAIEWLVLLQSGDASPDDHRDFARWQALDPRHRETSERMQGLLARSLAPVRQVERQLPEQSRLVERVMLRPLPPPGRRRVLRQSLGVAALAVAAGALTNRFRPLASLTADLSTGTGQRKRFELPDGSSLMLNARSAADIHFGPTTREVRLREGELIATVAADTRRPFLVTTRHGTARALGTRFLVSMEENRTMALVLEHSIRLDTGNAHLTLQRGEAAYYQPGGIERVSGDATDRSAWADGMLVINDQPLSDVVAALRRYREGIVRLSPEAASLRVLGAFPLDDTDNVLRSLEQALPLQIRRFGSLLVSIDLRPRT